MSSNNSSEESSSVPLFSGDEPTLSQLPAVLAAWDRERHVFSWESEFQPNNELVEENLRSDSNDIPEVNNYPILTRHVPMSPQVRTLPKDPTDVSDTSTEPPSEEFNWSAEGGVNNIVDQFAQPVQDSLDINEVLEIEKQFGFPTGTSSNNNGNDYESNEEIYKCSGDEYGCRYYACRYCFPNFK